MYVVAARNDVIRSCIERFDRAQIPLSVIEVPETAQRNLALLIDPEQRGLALLYLSSDHALLTVTFHGELYLGRRIDVGLDQVRPAAGEAREDVAAAAQELAAEEAAEGAGSQPAEASDRPERPLVEIPVRYGGTDGPDLRDVARRLPRRGQRVQNGRRPAPRGALPRGPAVVEGRAVAQREPSEERPPSQPGRRLEAVESRIHVLRGGRVGHAIDLPLHRRHERLL